MLDDEMVATTPRTGLWFIGARGSVATTATVGLLALQHGRVDPIGLVSEVPEVAGVGLVDLGAIVIGGHDVSTTALRERAGVLAAGGVIPPLDPDLADALDEIDRRIRPGAQTLATSGGHDAHAAPGQPSPTPHTPTPHTTTQRSEADRLIADLQDFRRTHGLARVVVVDVSSTEPPAPPTAALESLDDLESALDAGQSPLPPSSLYAYAAFRAGCSLAAFTPSTGPACPALRELALREGLPWAGRDGKTGETLVKSVLAPMFARRALRVNSWTAMNILGGGDGRTLADPEAAVSKTSTKGMTVSSIVGYPVEGPVRIDYVEDLGDWKTAWDNVTFSGFLGTRMTLQFTWQGCDSALAAPLVLDLARLLDAAHRAGRTGAIGELGFFFKDPIGADHHALDEQWHSLTAWCEDVARDLSRTAPRHAPTAP